MYVIMKKEVKKLRFFNQAAIEAIKFKDNISLRTALMNLFGISEQTIYKWVQTRNTKLVHPDTVDIVKTVTGLNEVLETSENELVEA